MSEMSLVEEMGKMEKDWEVDGDEQGDGAYVEDDDVA
jgi:hypothetical protein